MPLTFDQEKKTKTPLAGESKSPPPGEYTLTGDVEKDFDNIGRMYKPAELDDNTWRGVWRNVMMQESGGNLSTGESQSPNQKLLAGKRAYGVMQVTPKTGKGLGFTEEELRDPIYNFMAGVKNLRTEWDEIGKDKRVTSPDHRLALTFAAYHAGRGNVLAALDKGGDGVPDIDDGSVNTRDYTLNKMEALEQYLAGSSPGESDEPVLLSPEESAAKYGATEDSDVAPTSGDAKKPRIRERNWWEKTFLGEEPPADWMTRARSGQSAIMDTGEQAPRVSFEEELVQRDRAFREALGLIVPTTAPRNFTGKPPKLTFEIQRNEDGSFAIDENVLGDAVATALTGDNQMGARFRQEVGENVGFFNQDVTNQWLNDQIAGGNLSLSDVDGRLIVQGNIPVMNFVKNRIDAFARGGSEEVKASTQAMNEESNQYYRMAAEETYGREIAKLERRALESDRRFLEKGGQFEGAPEDVMEGMSPEGRELLAKAKILQAEMESKYPKTWLEDTWQGVKAGLAQGVYNVVKTGANLREMMNAPIARGSKEAKDALARDERVRKLEQKLESETPQARYLTGKILQAATSELIYSPIYISGGMMMGPAGGIMTSALRSANKPMDEALKDIGAAIFEVGAGSLLKGAFTAGKGLSPRKEFLAEMGIGGITEAGGEAAIEVLQGKAIDWNNALMNLIIGAGMEAGSGARDAITNQARPEGEGAVKFGSAEPTQFDTEVRSPVVMTKAEDGTARFGAVVRQGDSFGFIEIPKEHPIILKHMQHVDSGQASFIGVEPEQFDSALTEWKGTSEGIKLPKLNAQQFAEYLKQVNPNTTAERDKQLEKTFKEGVSDENIEGQVANEDAGLLPETQQGEGQVKEQKESASEGSGDSEVLGEPKTYRRYNKMEHALDADLAKQWDEAEEERDNNIRGAVRGQNEGLNQGAMIRANISFSNVRKDLLKEQARRDEERDKGKPKTTTTPIAKTEDFKAGRIVKAGGVDIRLPEDLSRRWQMVQDDAKALTETIRDDKTLTLPERQRRTKEVNKQRLEEQNRILNEFRTREEETTKRGYLRDSDRPLSILEDRGDELVVKVAGEDATRIVKRDEIETRKERALKRKKDVKLPLSVRTKVRFGAFKEGRTASHATEGAVYINDTAKSKIEDALGVEIGTGGFTFKTDNLDEALDALREAGLEKIADQLEAQKKAANGRPALVNVDQEDAGLSLQHERIHQKASDKELPRPAVERLFSDGGAVDTLLNESSVDLKNLNNYDKVQEILAYGLTGDHESLGVDPDTLYDALLDVIQSYISAFPNEELGVIFDNAVVDVDTIKNEANRRIKYAAKEPERGEKTVRAAREPDKAGEPSSSEKGVGEQVRRAEEKPFQKFGYKREVTDLSKASEHIEIDDALNAVSEAMEPSEVRRKQELEEIARKPVREISRKDVRTVIETGNFAQLSGSTGAGTTLERNAAKTRALKRELEKMGYKVLDSEGMFKPEDVEEPITEPSVFVLLNSPDDEANIIRLGVRYKQAQVLIGNNGEYRAPFTRNTPLGKIGTETRSKKNEVVFDPTSVEKSDGKSVVKTATGNFSYTIPDLFANTVKQAGKEVKKVDEITKAYKRSFKNRAKSTSANLITWLKQRKGDGKREDLGVRETGEFLAETTEEMYGKPPTDKNEAALDAKRTRRAVRDGMSILNYTFKGGSSREGDVATGKSWYQESIRKMHEITGIAFPEVLNQPTLRTLFDLTLAISSPANKVQANYNYATSLWRRVVEEFGLIETEGKLFPVRRKEFKIDKETGKRKQLKYGRFGPHLEKLNFMSLGYIPVDSTTAKEIQSAGGELKRSQAFKNVGGAQQWYAKDADLEKSIKQFGPVAGVVEYLLQPAKGDNDYFRATEVLGPKVGAFFMNISGFSQLVTVDMWASRWFYRINGDLVSKRTSKNKHGIQDSPKTKHDGDLIRGAMQAIANEWNSRNENKLTPADVQAVLWYAEKDIWHLAGSIDSGTIDFATAAENRIKDIVKDVDKADALRAKVIDRWTREAPDEGERAKIIGTEKAAEEGRNFYIENMGAGRYGLGHTSRKQVIHTKLKNFDASEWNNLAERSKGDSLNAKEIGVLYNLLQRGYQASTEAARQKVREELMDFLNDISSQSLGEFLLLLRKAGMLSGIKTSGRNILSNFAFGVLEEMQRGVAAPMDVMISVATGRERTIQGWSPIGIARSAAKAMTEGLRKSAVTFAKGDAGITFEDINYDPKLKATWVTGGRPGTAFLNATVGNFAKYIFRFQKAQDVFFREYAYNRAMYEIAALNKKNAGIPIANTLANPSAGEADLAWRMAEVAVFQNENKLNTAYQRFKAKRPKPIRYLLDYQLPFIKTGSNIFSRTMDYLGIGGVYKVMELFSEIDDKQYTTGKAKMWAAIDNPESRRVLIEIFSRGFVGLGIATIGWFLAAAGYLNGMDDDDPKERNRRIAEGSGPGHLRVGDTWYDIRGVSPVSTILLSGASSWRALNKDMKDESKRYDAMIAVASNIVIDGLPLARAVSDYVNPKSGRSVVQRAIGAESLVPAIVAEIAATMDTVQRDTKGDSLEESIKKSVKARIPGKREELPAKTDVFGRELEEPKIAPVVPIAGALSPKKAKDDKVLKEASNVGWSMTPPKRDTKNNESRDDFNKRKRKTQELITRVFDAVINDPEYGSGFSKDERKAILDESANTARQTIKQGGSIDENEMRDIVEAILGKAKDKAEIDKETDMDKEEKSKAKQSISTKYSKFISPATKE